MRAYLGIALLLALTRTSAAQSPNTDPVFREGANHHLGDDAFRSLFGREPTTADERLRMHTHFVAVKQQLAGKPATRPELAARRAQILAYFDDYIAKGTTPKNGHLPWRTPVFIDDEGTICAVGYLIERTVGREAAERVAKDHRYAYLEEIAAAMPEVASWVAESGLTLAELSSIQPGYEGPEVDYMVAWNPRKLKLPDGAYDENGIRGALRDHQMDGVWTRTDEQGRVIGRGTLALGEGTWRSSYPDGTRMAEGRYKHSQPTGRWRFYHRSGALAAEGRLRHGARDGEWRFYYDTPARTPIAIGAFAKGVTTSSWKHFDADGKLLATSRPDDGDWEYGGMFRLDIVPGADGVRHTVDEGNIAGDTHRLDEISDGTESLFVQSQTAIYDRQGMKLERGDGGWITSDCHWDAARKEAARNHRIGRLHSMIYRARFDAKDGDCDGARPVPAARGRRIDTLLASVRAVRAQSPEFMRKLALGEATVDDAVAPEPEPAVEDAATRDTDLSGDGGDLAKVLAASMLWYVEWPHVDQQFVNVYATLAGMTSTSPM